MYKKVLFALAVAAALLSSCDKQEINEQPTVADGSGLIVKVTVPQTKLDYEETVSGLSLTFKNEKDRLIAYFRNAEGTMIESAVTLNLDPSTLSVDKKSATFKAGTGVSIPAEATSIFFYLDNEDNDMYSLTGASINDLKNQDGTLDDVAKHQVIVGSTDVAGMTTDGDGNKVADISFSYRTSVLKLQVTFPDGITPTADENTTITITDPDVYNSVRIAWGEPHSTTSFNTKGAISVHPCSVSGQVATAYVTVWGSSLFDDATITGNVNGVICSVDFDAAGATVAGKVHKVSRTLSITSFSVWKDDTSSSISYAKNLTVGTKDEWISYDSVSGAISYTANTTGSYRDGSIVFTEGYTVGITQLEVKDFKGTWTVNSKKFNKAGGTGAVTTTNSDNTDVVFGDPFKADAADGETNNIGITGLFDNYVLDAAIDIDYSAKTYDFSLFFDGSTAQALSTPLAGYSYVIALPGLGHSFIGGGYDFIPSPITDTDNYLRVWFTSDSFDKVSFKKTTTRYYVKHNSDEKYMVIAISFALANKANVSSTSDLYSSYSRVYQANPNNDTDAGISFNRK